MSGSASISMRTGRKQMSLNMLTTIISQVLSLGISFFLTPFIVKQLGAAAYGFVGLSNNIIGYTGLLTVALNSMSGRFISIEYHKSHYAQANGYLSSTFYANCIMSVAIILIMGVMTIFLDNVLNIPANLIKDVKFLFTLIFVNSSIGLCTTVIGLPYFIKNRVDLQNIIGMFTNVIRVCCLVIMFGFFPAHLWYIGAVGLICTMAWVGINYYYFRNMTPELSIKLVFFNWSKVWEMVREGVWNIVSQLSSILNQGLQLLLTNLFIGAYWMGMLSIASAIPFILVGISAALGGNFHPECVKLYAEGDMNGLRQLLVKAVRIIGVLASIPCACVFVFGDVFYSVWMPEQNINLLYSLTAIIMVWLMTTLPTQTLWYVFTITKTVRHSSMVLIKYGILNCVFALLAVNLFEDNIAKLYAICFIQTLLGIIRFTTFLPFYSAKVLGLDKYTFLKPLLNMIIATTIIVGIGFIFKTCFISTYSWGTLIMGVVFVVLISVIVNWRLVLTKSDCQFVMEKIFRR